MTTPSLKTLSLLAVAAGALALPEIGFAQATVNWGLAQDTQGPGDVANGGTVVEARNGLIYVSYLADSPMEDVTIGGVLFDATNFLGAQFANEPMNSFISFHTSGDMDYDILIGNVTSCDAPTLGNGSTQTSANYQIQGLTVGVEYLIQVWYCDVRNISDSREITVDGAVTILSGQSSDSADLGQYVIGTFSAAATTQLVNFDTLGTSGRAGISAIMVRVNDGSGLGTNFCGPAVVNASGNPASLIGAGSSIVANNDLTVTALNMTPVQFGFFIVSQTQGFVSGPGGSLGNLCLGGSIGRFVGPGQIMMTGNQGTFSIDVDLTAMPQPVSPVPVNAGETWRFQAWFRDIAPGGGSASNFTDGLEITFQ